MKRILIGSEPRALGPPDIKLTGLESTRFWLDDAGNWISGDAFWTSITGLSFEVSVGARWVHCLDSAAYFELHEGFVRLNAEGIPLQRAVTVKLPSHSRSAFLRLERNEMKGGGILGVISLKTYHSISATAIGRTVSAEANPLGRMNRRLGIGLQLLSAMFLLCALSGVVLVSLRMGTSDVSEQQRVGIHADKLGMVSQQKVEDGRQLVYRYHESTSLGERLVLMLGDSRTLESKLKEHDKVVYPVAQLLRSEVLSFNGVPHLVAQGMDTSGGRFLDMVDLSGEYPKLNWEASTGFCEVSLSQYRTNPPEEAVVMRLLIRPDDYYNRDFADTRRWSSYYVSDQSDSEGLFAYAEHGSPVQGELQELFPNAIDARLSRFREGVRPAFVNKQDIKPRRVTVRLEAGAGQLDQVRIVEILGEDWVCDPGEVPRSLAAYDPFDSLYYCSACP